MPMGTRDFVLDEKYYECADRLEDVLIVLEKQLKCNDRILEDLADDLESILEEIDYQVSCLEEIVYDKVDEDNYF